MINKLLQDYNSYPLASNWMKANEPSPNLIYNSGVGYQVKQGLAISNIVSFNLDEPKVANTHTSKSCKLPVLMFKIWHYENGGAFCFIRDNFYDIKLSVVSEFPIDMNYSYMHHEMSQKEYDAEKKRCIDYNSKPPVSITEEEKEGDKWMDKWSSNKILRKDNKIWKAYSVAHCEGIEKLDLPSEVFRPYETGHSMFTIATASFAHVAYLLEHIQNNVQHGAYLKLKAARGE
jgi:hypothetical protein